LRRANATFYSRKDKSKREEVQQVYEVHDVEVFEEPWDLSRLEEEPVMVLRSEGLKRTAKVVASQLRTTLDEVSLDPSQIVDMLEDNFKRYFDPETEQIFSGRKRRQTKPIMWMLKVILEPIIKEVKETLSNTIFPCSASMIHCGIWDWYLRGYADSLKGDPGSTNYFEGVHLDGKLMLGESTREAETLWGIRAPNTSLSTPGNGWWNIWILLSPDMEEKPLLLLDPRTWNTTAFLEQKRPFLWPGRDFNTKSALRWLAPLSMRFGDVLVFQSATVAHGAGRLVDSKAETAPRLSLDARCHCSSFSSEPVRTITGEICAPVWSFGGKSWHGCQRIGSNRSWCIIYRRADDAGAGCVLGNETLCNYPCQEDDDCTIRNFDFCE